MVDSNGKVKEQFEFFDHQADIGIIGMGGSIETAFEQGAKAMFQVMAEVDCVEPKQDIGIRVEATDESALFIEWLNELLAKKDIEEMMFSEFEVKIKKNEESKGAEGFILLGKAKGEKINIEKHKLKTEVKAATYSQLKVAEENGVWKAQCVVDV